MEKIEFKLKKAEFKGIRIGNYDYELYFDEAYDLFIADNSRSDPECEHKPLTFRLRAYKLEIINDIVNKYKPEEFFMKDKIEEIQSLYDVECGIW
jgi:hypothetical protein